MVADKSMNGLVGSVVTLFNDSNAVPLPNSSYTGSFFFGPNQTVTFRNRSPKGRIRTGESDMDSKSFGNGWKRNKLYNIHMDFFTVENYTDSEGNKNVELLNRYSQLTEDALRNNVGSYGGFSLVTFSDEVPPQRADEIGNNVWVISKLIVFRERS